MGFEWIIIIAMVVGFFIYRKHQKEKTNNGTKDISKSDDTTENYNQIQTIIDTPEELTPYRFKYLFTKNEYYFYKALNQKAEEKGYIVMAKVRLADLVEVDDRIVTTKSDKFKYFHKISQKHVDFVLLNKTTSRVEKIIEVDDSSHNQVDRAQRDIFVDKVLKKAGYIIYHINTVDEINRIFI